MIRAMPVDELREYGELDIECELGSCVVDKVSGRWRFLECCASKLGSKLGLRRLITPVEEVEYSRLWLDEVS